MGKKHYFSGLFKDTKITYKVSKAKAKDKKKKARTKNIHLQPSGPQVH